MTVNRNKRSVAALALSATAIFALAACSGGTTPAETNTPAATNTPTATETQSQAPEDSVGSLTVWVDQERVAALQGVVDAYTAESGIDVNLVGRNVDDIKNDFIQQVPTGDGPDIVMGAHDWVGELTTNGVVAPLEFGDAAANFAKVAIDASTYDGTTYLLPYAVENIAVLRNVDLVPEPATNWDDMLSKGKFVVETGADGNPYHYYPFQTAFGAPVFGSDENGYNASDLQLGSQGGFDFANWLGEQGKNGDAVFNTDITGDIAKQQFLDGEAAFWLTGPWNVGAAVEGGINVAIDPVPSPTDQAASPFAGVKGFYLSAESKNKVAANDFLVNYLGSTEAQVELFKAGNVLPALIDAQAEASADPIIAGFAKVGEQAVPMPAIPEMGSVWEFWGVAEAAIINGEDPAATWQKLVDDVAAAIAAG